MMIDYNWTCKLVVACFSNQPPFVRARPKKDCNKLTSDTVIEILPIIRLSSLVFYLVLGYFVYISGILGAQLIYGLIFLFLCGKYLFPLVTLSMTKKIIVGLLALLMVTFSFFIQDILTVPDSIGSDIQERLTLLYASLDVSIDRWFWGFGSGHWLVAMQSNFVDNSITNLALHGFLPLTNHSWLSKLVVEFGLLGLMLFYLPLMFMGLRLLSRINRSTDALFLLFILALFMVNSEIYASLQFSNGHFSNLFYLLLFFMAGYDVKLGQGA